MLRTMLVSALFGSTLCVSTSAAAQGQHVSSAVWEEVSTGFSIVGVSRFDTAAGLSVVGRQYGGDIDIDGTTVSGSADTQLIVHLDDDGSMVWARTDVTTPSHIQVLGVRRGSQGQTLVGGDLDAPTTFGLGWPGDPVGGRTLHTTGQQNAFVVAYAADGHLIGGRGFGGGGSTSAGYGFNDLAVTQGGGDALYVVGTRDGAFEFAGVQRMPAQGDGAYIVRVSPSGQYEWGRAATGAVDISNNTPLLAAGLNGGGVVVAGTFDGLVDFDDGNGGLVSMTGGVQGHLFLVKYFWDGTLAWTTSTESPSGINQFELIDMTAAPDRSVYVLGRVGFGDTIFGAGEPGETIINNPYGTTGLYTLARYHPNGTLDWAQLVRDYTANATGGGHTLDASDPGGSVLVAGTFSGTVTFCPDDPAPLVITSTASADMFVLRVDDTGACQWLSTIVGDGTQLPVGLATDHLTGASLVAGVNEGLDVTFGPGEAGEESFATPDDFAFFNVLSP